jgi:hypothetical protein
MVPQSRHFSARIWAIFAIALALFLPGIGHAQETAADEHSVFFGWLLGTPNIAAVAVDIGAPDDDGKIPILAYVCDGLGAPDGMAVWFKGSIDQSTIIKPGGFEELTSPSGEETLAIGYVDDYGVRGTFTRGDSEPVRFATFRAIDGGGIYDVTLDEDLRYTGTSTDGSTLNASVLDDGYVTGTITTAEGEEVNFYVQAMALAPPEQLAEFGLPTAYTDFAEQSVVPGTYVAVISPGGAFWLGRSGNVRDGNPGKNIIGLDAAD